MITDIFASLSFYLVPYLTGALVSKKLPFAFAIGTIFYFILFLILTSLHLSSELFVSSVKIISLSICAISGIKLASGLIFSRPKLPILEIFFLFTFSLLAYFVIFKYKTPYPYPLNWDIFEHMTLTNKIISGHFSFFSSQISDTFTLNSYPPTFHILFSLPKIIFNRPLLGIYWWLEYWHYLLIIVASYLLAKKLFGKNSLALLSGLLGGLIFESQIVYSFFLLPQTLTALLTVFAITEIVSENKPKIGYVLITFVALLLIHYFIGSVGSMVIFMLLCGKYLSLKTIRIGNYFSMMLFFILLLLHFLGNWALTQREEALHFKLSAAALAGFFLDWYGLILPIFLPLGTLIILRKSNNLQISFLSTAFLLLGLALAPFSYLLKTYALGRYFINTIISVGTISLIEKMPKKIQLWGFFWIVLALVVIFIKSAALYKNPLYFKGIESNISSKEIEAANWLTRNSPKNSLLISDPATQNILEALSEVNTQGGTFMDEQTRAKLISLNTTSDLGDIKKIVYQFEDRLPSEKSQVRLLVLSGRYFNWQKFPIEWKMSTYYNVWKPALIPLEGKQYIDFLRFQNASIVYENEEMAILKI